jgi:hypothetical protein
LKYLGDQLMVTKKTLPSTKKAISAPLLSKKESVVPAGVADRSTKIALAQSKSKPAAGHAKTSGKGKIKRVGKKSDSGIRLLQIGKPVDVKDKVFEPFHFDSGKFNFSYVLDGILSAQSDASLQSCRLWGLMTPDFSQRTGLDGERLLSLIEANPGFDLYFCSAHPEVEALYHNPWRTPEVTHAGFVALSRRFLKAAGLSDAPVDSISHSSLFSTGHLIVATPEIWAKYVNFVKMVFERVQKNLNSDDLKALFEEKQTAGRMTYLALIVARLLSVFMMLKSSEFRAFKIPLSEQENSMNSHLKFLREMKDFGLVQKSKWHLAAWLNYRGLYLAHVMGKAWIDKHIKEITPMELHAGMPVSAVVSPYVKSIQSNGSLS